MYVGDHPEGNDMCGIYRNKCRTCVDIDGLPLIRTTEFSRACFQQMYNLVFTQNERQDAYEVSQELGQHIVPVSDSSDIYSLHQIASWDLQFHDCFTQTPPDPGHFEDLGL